MGDISDITKRFEEEHALSDPVFASSVLTDLKKSRERLQFLELVKNVEGELNLTAPFSENELREINASENFNVNFGGLLVGVKESAQVLVDLVLSGETYATACSDFQEGSSDNRVWMREFALADKRLLDRLEQDGVYSYIDEVEAALLNASSFGLGVMVRENEESFLWRSRHPKDFHFVGESFEIDDMAAVFMTTEHDLTELFRIANEGQEGWDKEELQKYLQRTQTDHFIGRTKVKSNSINRKGQFDIYRHRVRLETVFSKDKEGKVARRVLAGDALGNDVVEQVFLYEKEGVADSFSDLVALVPCDLLCKTPVRVRGYGGRSARFHILENIMVNMMISRVLLASGIYLSSADEASYQRSDKIDFNSWNITRLPPGTNIEQVSLKSNIGEISSMQEMISGFQKERNRSMGGAIQLEERTRPLGETEIRVGEQGRMLAVEQSAFLRYWAGFVRARIRSTWFSKGIDKELMDYADRELWRLLDKNVPLEALYGERQFPIETGEQFQERKKNFLPSEGGRPSPKGVYLVDSEILVAGSKTAAQITLAQVKQQVAPSLTPAGLRELDRMMSTTLVGAKNTDRFFSRQPDLSSEQKERATQDTQNGTLVEGSVQRIEVGEDENHVVALTSINSRIQMLFEEAQAGVKSSFEVEGALKRLLAHAQGHQAFLQSRSEEIFQRQAQQFTQIFNPHIAALRKLSSDNQAALQAQAQGQSQNGVNTTGIIQNSQGQ